MSHSLDFSSVYGAFTAAGDCLVNVVGHISSVELACHSVVQTALAGVFRQFQIMCQVEEAWLKGVWHHSLYCAIECGGANHNAMTVVGVARARGLDSACHLSENKSLVCSVRSFASMGVAVSALGVLIGHAAGSPG